MATLSLLTITSRHIQHESTNSIIFHQGKPVARLLPAPPQQELGLSGHGARVNVHNLFGNIPVRVKRRALALQKPEEMDREWDELRRILTAVMLANNRCTKLSAYGLSRDRKFTIRSKSPSVPRSAAAIPPIDIERVVFLLRHAGFLASGNTESWTSLSASTPDVSIQAAISLVPSPTKQVQFMSLGMHPIFPRNNANVLFNEVNRIFTLSDFGAVESVRESGDTNRSRTGQMDLRTGFKFASKAVNRWPMFYIRIDIQSYDGLISEESDILTSDNSLQHILDVLSAMLHQFLRQLSLRPRAERRKNEGPLDTYGINRQTSEQLKDSSKHRKPPELDRPSRRVASSTEESLDGRIVLPRFQNRPSTSMSLNFSGWSRIKSGRESTIDTICSGLPRGKLSAPATAQKSRDRVSSINQDSENQGKSTGPAARLEDNAMHEDASVHHESRTEDGTSVWVDPVSKTRVLINSRTGQVVPLDPSMAGPAAPGKAIFRPRSANILQTRSRPEMIRRPASALPAVSGGWLDDLMKRWNSPVLSHWEKPITSIDPAMNGQAGKFSLGNDYNCSVFPAETEIFSGYKGKLSKTALQRAEVIAQVDCKFILLRMIADPLSKDNLDEAGSILTIVDQHAADERCRVEKLFEEVFVSPSATGGLNQPIEVQTTELLPPIIFEISAAEYRLFERRTEFLALWGCHYELSKAPETKGGKVYLTALPTGIVERCRTEPSLAIDMLRSEIWKCEETGESISGPASGTSSISHLRQKRENTFQPPDQDEILVSKKPSSFWVDHIADCPQGIIDLLNSRACRSAIMFNDRLTLDECRHLISRLSRCVFPFQCAHGRPTMIPVIDLRSQNLTEDEFGLMAPISDSFTGKERRNSRDEFDFVDAFKAWKKTEG